MKSPSAALIWELWRRNRLLIAAMVFVFFLGCGLGRQLDKFTVAEPEAAERLNTAVEAFKASQADLRQRIPRGQARRGAPVEVTRSMQAWDQAQRELEHIQQMRKVCQDILTSGGVIWIGMSILLIMASATGVEPSNLRGFTGIPPRRFVLPVRPSVLIFWPMVSGVALVWAVWLAWSHWVFGANRFPSWPDFDLYFGLLLAAGLIWFLGLVWALPSFPKFRAALLTGFVFLFVGLLSAHGMDHGRVAGNSWQHQAPLWFAASIPLGLWFTWAGVRAERHGGWTEPEGSQRFREWLGRRRRPARSFVSAFRAQAWMEWRGNFRLPLLIWFGFVSFTVIWQLWNFRQNPMDSRPLDGVMGILTFAMPMWALAMGLHMTRDPASRQAAVGSFLATRPTPPDRVIVAKLVAACVSWLMAWALLIGTQWAIQRLYIAAGNQGVDALEKNVDVIILGLLVSFNFMVGILPLCLTGRVPRFPRSLLPWLGAYVAACLPIWWLVNRPAFQSEYPVVQLGIAVLSLKLILGAAGCAWSLARGLASVRYLAMVMGIWMVGVSVALCMVVPRMITQADGAIIPVVLALLAAPFVRLAWAPMAYASNRAR